MQVTGLEKSTLFWILQDTVGKELFKDLPVMKVTSMTNILKVIFRKKPICSKYDSIPIK